MQKKQPLVSVLCLSMNHEKYIEKSFLSAINQTYGNIEILYVDNHSGDFSFKIADELFKKSGLSYKGHEREKGYGISENLNFLIKQAKGKYIAPLSADDWWDVNNLEEKINFYEQHSSLGMLHGRGYLYFYETQKKELEKMESTKSGWVLSSLIKRNFVNTIGIIIKKEVFDTVGMFDEKSPLEDWDMWIRIAEKYEIGFYNKALVYYGKTGSNISDNENFMKEGYEYIFKKYGHYKEITDAKFFFKLHDIYHVASDSPTFKNLFLLLKYYQFTFLHFKQVVKCFFGILGLKIRR